jgi:hypothetical protein
MALVSQFYFTEFIYRFRLIFRINSDYFCKQHYPTGFCNGDSAFLQRYELKFYELCASKG